MVGSSPSSSQDAQSNLRCLICSALLDKRMTVRRGHLLQSVQLRKEADFLLREGGRDASIATRQTHEQAVAVVFNRAVVYSSSLLKDPSLSRLPFDHHPISR